MQKYKKLIIYILAIIISYGCNQNPPNKNISLSPKVESIINTSTTNNIRNTNEVLSVIYKSSDLGTTWYPFDNGIPKDATLSGIKQYGNKLYVATDYNGVYVSTNGKDNWVRLNENGLKGLDINCIEVERNNLIIGTLKQGIYLSKDGGLNWNKSKNNIKSSVRAFIWSGNKLYAGTDSGIYESIDKGESWSHVFGQIQILGFTSLKEKIYAATQNGVIMNNEYNTNWKIIYNGDALHDISNDGKFIYAMTIGQQLLKTKNDGEQWENAQNGIPSPPNFYTNELQYIEDNIYSAQWIGIYHSTDNGNNWRILNGLPNSTAFSTLEITDLGIIAGISIR